MYNILKLNKICPIIDEIFTSEYNCGEDIKNPDGIIVRSFKMADYEIGEKLLAVGRAGAGVNNIPLDKMSEKGVVVFNTPGANANAVKELVICGMLLSSRDIIGGNQWVNTLNSDVAKQTEKGKGQFGGTEIKGKTLGVIGLGAIGILVANASIALGMKVIGYDPFLSEGNKNKLDKEVETGSLDEVFAKSDIITLHVPLLDSTRNIIDASSLAKCKDGLIILNMARGGLVNVEDIKVGLKTGKVRKYVVDFPDESVLNVENIIVLPHLGASTEEAEENCAVMAANQMVDYFENGNIVNSVNFPCITKIWDKKYRICIISKGGVADKFEHVEDIVSARRGDYNYTIIDTDKEISIPKLDNILKVRYLSRENTCKQ